MNSFVKCYDVVSAVTDVATEQFAPNWKVNKESETILKQYCAVFDNLAKEFGGIAFEVSVDEIQMTICIKMECSDICIQSQTHQYISLIKRAVSFGFSRSESGNLIAEFVFPSIWESAYSDEQ